MPCGGPRGGEQHRQCHPSTFLKMKVPTREPVVTSQTQAAGSGETGSKPHAALCPDQQPGIHWSYSEGAVLSSPPHFLYLLIIYSFPQWIWWARQRWNSEEIKVNNIPVPLSRSSHPVKGERRTNNYYKAVAPWLGFHRPRKKKKNKRKI